MCIACIGDENLGTVKYVVITIFYGHCLLCGSISSGIRFSQAKSSKPLAAGKFWKVLFLLLFCSVVKDCILTKRSMSRNNNARSCTNSRKFLNCNGVHNMITTGAAVFFRSRDSKDSKFCHLLDVLYRKLLLLIYLSSKRFNLFLRKFADHLLK